MLEVEAGRQAAEERDARPEEDDEERAKGGVLLHPREAADQSAPQGGEEAGDQRPGKEPRRAGAEEQPAPGDARQERMGEGIAHEGEPAQDEDAAQQTPAQAQQQGRQQRPLHEAVGKGGDDEGVQAQGEGGAA